MGDFETVVIRREGSHYRVTQGATALLSMPAGLFEGYEADSVFPPQWRAIEESHPVRRLFWNPVSLEFLMAGLEAHPARVCEAFGSSPYRAYLQGFWIPSPPVALLKPFWNPEDPYDPFDAPARRKSFDTQQRFLRILRDLKPPAGWTAILNAVDDYLDALGVNVEGTPSEPGAVREVSLTPPGPLQDTPVRLALETLALEHVGACFPVLREGVLVGAHALGLKDLLTAQALFAAQGLACQEGPYRPH